MRPRSTKRFRLDGRLARAYVAAMESGDPEARTTRALGAAAGCDHKTASAHLLAMGYPPIWRLRSPKKDRPPTTSPPVATVPTDQVGRAAEEPILQPTAPPGYPPTLEQIGEALARWVGVEMRAANNELASTVRASITGLSRRNAYRDAAVKRAIRASVHAHAEPVKTDAAEIDDPASEAGLLAERYWKDHALADTFPEGPGQMTRVARASWQENRDATERLRKENAALIRTIIGLREQFDSAFQRERAIHRVWQYLAVTAVAGERIDPEMITCLLYIWPTTAPRP